MDTYKVLASGFALLRAVGTDAVSKLVQDGRPDQLSDVASKIFGVALIKK